MQWMAGVTSVLPSGFCDDYYSVACGCGQTENVLTNLRLSPLRIFSLIAQRCECLYNSVLIFGMFRYFVNFYLSKIQGGHMPVLHPLPALMDVTVWCGRLYQPFGERCCLHLQGYLINQRKRRHIPGNEFFSSSEMCFFL